MGLGMPPFHQRPNHSLRLPIGLWATDLGEALWDLRLHTRLDKRMRRGGPGPFPAIISVPTLDGIGAFLLDLFQKRGGRHLGLIGQNCSKQLAREVINSHKQVLLPPRPRVALQHGQLPGVRMDHLAWIVFIVAFRLVFQPGFNLAFDFCQAFDAVLDTPKALVGAVVYRKNPLF